MLTKLEAEQRIVDELTPPLDHDLEGEDTFNKQARFMGAVIGRWATETDGKELRNALMRLVKRGTVVGWSNSGVRTNYALRAEEDRARAVIARRVDADYDNSFDQQLERLTNAMLDATPVDTLAQLHAAGYAIVPRDNIRHTQFYLPRRDA